MKVNPEKEIVLVECCNCGMDIFMTQARKARLLESKELFYCLSGHGQQYTKSTSDKLRADLEKKMKEINELAREKRLVENELAELKKKKLSKRKKSNK
jgi:hypothetical protein